MRTGRARTKGKKTWGYSARIKKTGAKKIGVRKTDNGIAKGKKTSILVVNGILE